MLPEARARVHAAFEEAAGRFARAPGVRRLLDGEITVAHYGALLRQIFHHARENPQLQVLASVFFRGEQRSVVRPFFKHATSEIGHDQLALDDLARLGADVSGVRAERPLPETSALLGLAFYEIQHRNPVGYLGYLYFLEYLPTSAGAAYRDALLRIGVPADAMTFLHDHMTVDVGHNRLMEVYLDGLVTSEEDLDAVVYMIGATGVMYARMVEAAFAWADDPREPAPAREELRRAM
ncbi:MAG TPA: iron-containing redox enzyme family protein [Myxococcota bacterium]|nr:iron-containing redox enzyme family protein [Myxococcota bacterium]